MDATEPVEELPGIGLTPMIDIVFQLILFFLIVSHFDRTQQGLTVRPPLVSEAAEPGLVVTVGRDGAMSLGGRTVTTDEMKTELTAARDRNPAVTLLISGDGAGAYGHVFLAMQAATEVCVPFTLSEHTDTGRGQ